MNRLVLLAGASALTAACTPAGMTEPVNSAAATTPTNTADAPANEALANLFEHYDQQNLALYPSSKSYRGIIDQDYGRLSDYSDTNSDRAFELEQRIAEHLKASFDPDTLNAQDRLSYRLFLRDAEQSRSQRAFRDHGYLFEHRTGTHNSLPAFLINIHRVSEPAHADAYVSRIAAMGNSLRERTAEARARADKGIMPPDWVYPTVIASIDGFLSKPLDNDVLNDFADKVDALDIAETRKAEYKSRAAQAWIESVDPALRALREEMVRQSAITPEGDGVWRLPDGAAYYASQLASYTTTDLTPDEVHAIGLKEMARIHGEMRAIMKKVGFEGSLRDFFEYTRTDDRFFAKSREEYLSKVQVALDAMNEALPQYFGVLPTDPLVVKPVEPFRERAGSKAFYESPAPDGSRPGVYYANLYDLRTMSLNELEALAFHEGNPGHHLQLSIQTGLDGLPPFRRFGGYTAYTEGWGLYSEDLAKDMGFYKDPYSDFGRLQAQLWRAARLVVDTGLHHKRWSREEAIDYLIENTPNPEGDIVKAIERYIVYPGQATAYMIGKLKIMELRQYAMDTLGEDFSYPEFHDLVLVSGPRPLDILEEDVKAWVAAKKS